MAKPESISGLTSEQQSALYRVGMPVHEVEGFTFIFEDNGRVRIAFHDSPNHCALAVLMPTMTALEFARVLLRVAAQPQKKPG